MLTQVSGYKKKRIGCLIRPRLIRQTLRPFSPRRKNICLSIYPIFISSHDQCCSFTSQRVKACPTPFSSFLFTHETIFVRVYLGRSVSILVHRFISSSIFMFVNLYMPGGFACTYQRLMMNDNVYIYIRVAIPVLRVRTS